MQRSWSQPTAVSARRTTCTRSRLANYAPFAQTEVLVKFVETALIDEVVEELRAALEPRQLGGVTPDGPARVVKLTRAWLEDIRRAERRTRSVCS